MLSHIPLRSTAGRHAAPLLARVSPAVRFLAAEPDDEFDSMDFLDSLSSPAPEQPPIIAPVPPPPPPEAAAASPPPVDEVPIEPSPIEPSEPSPATAAIASADVGSSVPGGTPLLHRILPQAVLCIAGYMVHVCVLSRRSCPLPGGFALGWDTIAGLAVIAAAAKRRLDNGRTAVPAWLSSGAVRASADKEPEEAMVADFSAAAGKERVQLLITCAMLLVAPLLFSFAGPLVDVLLSILVLLGGMGSVFSAPSSFQALPLPPVRRCY